MPRAIGTAPVRSGHGAAGTREIDGLELPAVEKISETQRENAFHVLIGTLLSARTQDATTLAASTRLFKGGGNASRDGCVDGAADRTADLSGQLLPAQGAPRQSHVPVAARAVRRKVPSTMEDLLVLPGVGGRPPTWC
jgi:endonuclease III